MSAARGHELLQLRFHFGERDRDGDGPLEAAVMEACARHGVVAAVTLRGVEGFGAKHRLRTDRLLTLSEDAPLLAVAVAVGERVEALAADIEAMAGEGLVVLEPVRRWDGVVADGGSVKATVWGPRSGSASPHLAAVAAFHRRGAVAATVLLGVDGVRDGERRRARFVAGNQDVPAITVAIGTRAAIETALADLDSPPPLVTFEPVETSSRSARGSLHGNVATRVTLVTSEVAMGEHRPLYVELIHELRRQGGAGATALRGVWGFRGGREPHGDRVLALRRDVPIVVEAVDAPERAGRWEELARSTARKDDVVHLQSIPRATTLG